MNRPLPESLRPSDLEHFVGQPHLRAQIQALLNSPSLPSLLLFGPPGTGKTLLVRSLVSTFHLSFFTSNLALLLSHHAGESERQLASLFARARQHSALDYYVVTPLAEVYAQRLHLISLPTTGAIVRRSRTTSSNISGLMD